MKWKERGSNFEKYFSQSFHQRCCPVLISSLVLRSNLAGQIDMAGLEKKSNSWCLILYELKCSIYPDAAQWRRLRLAQDYLSRVLEMEVKLQVKVLPKR